MLTFPHLLESPPRGPDSQKCSGRGRARVTHRLLPQVVRREPGLLDLVKLARRLQLPPSHPLVWRELQHQQRVQERHRQLQMARDSLP